MDVALLSTALIRVDADNGDLLLDIPDIPESAPRSDTERDRAFTHVAMDGFDGAKVAGRVPWMHAGWDAIETANFDDSAGNWAANAQSVRPHLIPMPFTSVSELGIEPLREFMQIAMAEA